MSGSVIALVVAGGVFALIIGVVFAWTNARIRANNPPTRRQKIVLMTVLIVNLLIFWYLCFAVDDGEQPTPSPTSGVNVQHFTTLYDDVVQADRNLTVTAETLLSRPDDLTLETKLIGQKHYCLGLVSEYNARAKSFSQQDFRAVNLPREIDQAASETDCEERGSGRQR